MLQYHLQSLPLYHPKDWIFLLWVPTPPTAETLTHTMLYKHGPHEALSPSRTSTISYSSLSPPLGLAHNGSLHVCGTDANSLRLWCYLHVFSFKTQIFLKVWRQSLPSHFRGELSDSRAVTNTRRKMEETLAGYREWREWRKPLEALRSNENALDKYLTNFHLHAGPYIISTVFESSQPGLKSGVKLLQTSCVTVG